MNTRLLTDLERRRIRAFNKEDGDRTSAMRGLSTRCKQYLPKIQEDLQLIQAFLEHYETGKAKR